MNPQPDLDKLIKQTRRYVFEDGLRDFQMAILFAFYGLAIWLAFDPVWLGFVAGAMQRFGRWAAWINMLPIVFPLVAAWAVLPVMRFLRRNWLWREKGSVNPKRWQVSRRVNLIAGIIMVAGLGLSVGLRSLGLADDLFVLRMLWTSTGWAFGYTLIGVGRDIDLARYAWVGGAGGLLSTALLFLPLAFGQAGLWFGLLWAGLLACSGALALRQASDALTVGH